MTDVIPSPDELPPSGQILIYRDGSTQLQVRLDGQTVWLPQRLIAELFEVSVKTANEHLVNIYDEGELDPTATIRKFRIVQTEGKREVSRLVDHYNLDAILAVGYRVRSARGTAFRQWATSRLSENIGSRFKTRQRRQTRPPARLIKTRQTRPPGRMVSARFLTVLWVPDTARGRARTVRANRIVRRF